ncbi:DsbA family protein [Colwelliaceae bacterium MEBiC 14330]
MKAKLYYLHDPMCSWCWGYRPVWQALQNALPAHIEVEYVAGGLAPDSDEPMPLAQQQMIQGHWQTIEKKLGTVFNFDFWQKNVPRRSTYNACRAAIAADKQGFQQAMIMAIQQAYYLRALNPSDLDVLISLAKELNHQNNIRFELSSFIKDLSSDEINQELNRQINLAKRLSQQGFPSLILEINGVPQQIAVDYADYQHTLNTIINKLA